MLWSDLSSILVLCHMITIALSIITPITITTETIPIAIPITIPIIIPIVRPMTIKKTNNNANNSNNAN